MRCQTFCAQTDTKSDYNYIAASPLVMRSTSIAVVKTLATAAAE